MRNCCREILVKAGRIYEVSRKGEIYMKKLHVIIFVAMMLLFCGCGVMEIFQINEDMVQETPGETLSSTEDLSEEKETSGTEALTEATFGEGQELDFGEEQEFSDITQKQEKMYIGEYLDYDNAEPNLEIAKGEDGKYIVQIGIFRLCSLDDGVGELTSEGMTFTATDPAGNAIGGIITVEDAVAKVTFTNSTWEYLENGATYEYTKSSETPNIWGE